MSARPASSSGRARVTEIRAPLDFSFSGAFAKDELLDLSGGRFWQLTKNDGLGNFVRGQVLTAVADDLLSSQRVAVGRCRHEGTGRLTPLLVRSRDHRSFHDLGMLEQDFLDLQ